MIQEKITAQNETITLARIEEVVENVVRRVVDNALLEYAKKCDIDKVLADGEKAREQMAADLRREIAAERDLRQNQVNEVRGVTADQQRKVNGVEKTLNDLKSLMGSIDGSLKGIDALVAMQNQRIGKAEVDIETLQTSSSLYQSNQAAMRLEVTGLKTAIWGNNELPDAPDSIFKQMNIMRSDFQKHVIGDDQWKRAVTEAMGTLNVKLDAVVEDIRRRRERMRKLVKLALSGVTSKWARLLVLLLGGGAGAALIGEELHWWF